MSSLILLNYVREDKQKLSGGLLALKALHIFELTVAAAFTQQQQQQQQQEQQQQEQQQQGLIINPYSICETLWSRAREAEISINAFASKHQRPLKETAAANIFSSILYSQHLAGLPLVYAPLTSACMQLGKQTLNPKP